MKSARRVCGRLGCEKRADRAISEPYGPRVWHYRCPEHGPATLATYQKYDNRQGAGTREVFAK